MNKTSKPDEQRPAGTTKSPPAQDLIDEASEESFPASDPPTFTGATATPTQKPDAACNDDTAADDRHSP